MAFLSRAVGKLLVGLGAEYFDRGFRQQFQRLDYVEGAGWTNLTVPGNWEMAGFSPTTYYGPDTTSGLYRDWFQVPASWQGRQVYLYFDGVQSSAQIWVNASQRW